ncbi:hypothetical protein BD413DRAFT_155081 [Trametes elegans]|nr:hypothetical protein BD413DRAFT_155081 [Trametes elegans]
MQLMQTLSENNGFLRNRARRNGGTRPRSLRARQSTSLPQITHKLHANAPSAPCVLHTTLSTDSSPGHESASGPTSDEGKRATNCHRPRNSTRRGVAQPPQSVHRQPRPRITVSTASTTYRFSDLSSSVCTTPLLRTISHSAPGANDRSYPRRAGSSLQPPRLPRRHALTYSSSAARPAHMSDRRSRAYSPRVRENRPRHMLLRFARLAPSGLGPRGTREHIVPAAFKCSLYDRIGLL